MRLNETRDLKRALERLLVNNCSWGQIPSPGNFQPKMETSRSGHPRDPQGTSSFLQLKVPSAFSVPVTVLARGTQGWTEQARCLSSQISHSERETDIKTRQNHTHTSKNTMTGCAG